MRDVGKHFTINYMLAKDSVQSRIEGGISFTEFSYMLLQAYDFLELNRREGVTLQMGGSDQWGNITAGLELIRRVEGKTAHALTMPLVTTASGSKFGKTEAGAVWLDPARTSPYKFYQYWINVDDRDTGKYLRLFTLFSRKEIEALDKLIETAPEKREAQQALAREVTSARPRRGSRASGRGSFAGAVREGGSRDAVGASVARVERGSAVRGVARTSRVAGRHGNVEARGLEGRGEKTG